MINELVLQHRMYETLSVCCGNVAFFITFITVIFNFTFIGDIRERTMTTINIIAGCLVTILVIASIITAGLAASYPTEKDTVQGHDSP